MIRFNINGQYLDTPEGLQIQLQKINPLFAFDALKCERSTSFDVPATPNNDRIFDVAKVPAYYGRGMRVRYAASMEASAVVKRGYLYVTEYDGGKYKCVFVTGELLGLQAIKELGKLSEIMEYEDTIKSNYTIKPANDPTFKTKLFDAYRYDGSAGVTIYPSVNIGLLIDKICAHIGVQCATPAAAYEMRLATPSLELPSKIEGAHIKSERTGGDPYNTIFADLLARGLIEERVLTAQRTVTYHRGHGATQGEVLRTDTFNVNVAHFRTLNNIAITFPDDFPNSYYLCYMNPSVSAGCVFLGDYSFTRPQVTTIGEGSFLSTGEPLAGRTVEIEAGTSFILVRGEGSGLVNDYLSNAANTYIQIDDEPVAVTAVTRGWDFSNGLQYDFIVDIDFNEEGATTYRLQDNLPRITFVELLKAVAAELGLILFYSEADGLSFDPLSIADFNGTETPQVIRSGNVTRTFADYARRNIVRYKEDDAFIQNETPAAYTIDNDNLNEENELQVIPWTNGAQYVSSYGVLVYDMAGRKEFLELRYNGVGISSLRASVRKNEGVQALCDASTSVQIRARMSMLAFERLTPKAVIVYNNTRYVWTEARWSEGAATIQLAKIQ